MTIRRRFDTSELRELAQEVRTPRPWREGLASDISAALRYCADLIDAADAMILEGTRPGTAENGGER